MYGKHYEFLKIVHISYQIRSGLCKSIQRKLEGSLHSIKLLNLQDEDAGILFNEEVLELSNFQAKGIDHLVAVKVM